MLHALTSEVRKPIAWGNAPPSRRSAPGKSRRVIEVTAQSLYGNQAVLRSRVSLADSSPTHLDVVLRSSRDSDTFCDLDTGQPVVTIRNEKCGKPCTQRHEECHVNDIRPCCARAGAAQKRATDEKQKRAVKGAWEGWLNANRHFLECRAYKLGVQCIDQLKKSKDCHVPSPPDRACCHDLDNYRFSEVDARDEHCEKAKKFTALTPCPFE